MVAFPSLQSGARWRLAGAVALGTALLWAYLPTLRVLAERWTHESEYSHGFLVPVFGVVLLWLRRQRFAPERWQWSWTGVLVLLAGAAVYQVAGKIFSEWLEDVSLLISLAGFVLVVGGRPAWSWAWPAVVFNVFMIPLPYRAETLLRYPLRHAATVGSTFVLQTLGFPAVSEGNVILLGDYRIGVAEACSGLSMLMLFIAFAVAMAAVIRCPRPDKLLLVVSAVPIAIVANIARITGAGIVYHLMGGPAADVWIHRLSGWLMMPVALALLWGEFVLLGRLFPPAAAAPRRWRQTMPGPWDRTPALSRGR
jgi:exosortase